MEIKIKTVELTRELLSALPVADLYQLGTYAVLGYVTYRPPYDVERWRYVLLYNHNTNDAVTHNMDAELTGLAKFYTAGRPKDNGNTQTNLREAENIINNVRETAKRKGQIFI